MNKYCAFLKQVRFRKEFIKMSDIKALFKRIGFNNIESVLATGNIIFTSNNKTKNELHSFIKENLSKYYSFDIDVFIKDIKEIQDILNENPFEIKKEFYIQTFICNDKDNFEKVLINEFNKIEPIDKEKAIINSNKLYWYYEKETRANSSFLKLLSKNSLKHDFTIRTIGSMKKVCERMCKLN